MSTATEKIEDPAVKRVAAQWHERRGSGLSPAENKELEAWLVADPRHRAVFDRFEAVANRFDRGARPAVADRLLQNLTSRVARRRRNKVVVGAVVAVAFTAAMAFRGALFRSSVPAANVATSPVILRPDRQILADSTILESRPGSRFELQYSVGLRRVVVLEGAVFVRVAKDPARPFVVSGGAVEARALGTAFSVELTRDTLEVVVSEGKVAVLRNAESGGPSVGQPLEAILDAGNRVVVSRVEPTPELAVVPVKPVEMEQRLGWLAPRVEFTFTPLSQAVAVLNEQAAKKGGGAGVRFRVADPAIASLPVNGLFRVDRTEAFIALLADGFGVEAERKEGGDILLRARRN